MSSLHVQPKILSALVLGALLLAATGCAKEELVAPGPVPHLDARDTPIIPGDTITVDPDSNNGTVSPITDDGDDQGDREHSNNHK